MKASKSSQLSISSRIIYFGQINFIWRISIFLFSQPENQTFKSLSKNFSSILSSDKYFFINLLNTNGESSLTSSSEFFKFILYIVLKYSLNFIQAISGTFWKDKNSPALLLSSGDNSSKFFHSKITSQSSYL